MRTVIVNLAGYLVGFSIALIGAFVHSLILLRVGLLLVALGVAAGGAFRLQAWASLGKRPPPYGVISIGLRLAAAIALLIIAVRVHF